MCGDIDVMLSEEDGYYTVIEVNELALSGSLTPFHSPNNTRVYVLFLPAVLRKQTWVCSWIKKLTPLNSVLFTISMWLLQNTLGWSTTELLQSQKASKFSWNHFITDKNKIAQ